MRIRDDLAVGAATHTGRVRSTNEDDYVLLAPETPALHAQLGRWFVIADGMGGVTGGAEASRIAVRALCAMASRSSGLTPEERMRRTFQAACQRVFAHSRANPSLRDMGTTMTALNLVGRRLVIGHVGDSRCLLLREGRLRRLTEDHTSSTADHHLTRCIGGGRDEERVDLTSRDLQKGDTLLLATDGLWEAVPEDEIAAILRAPPVEAAVRLVQTANARGGLDNATAVVFSVLKAEESTSLVDVDLQREEPRDAFVPLGKAPAFAARRWPWLLAVVAVLLSLAAGAKLAFGLDVVALAEQVLGGG